MTNNISLSACLVVHNEEKIIKRCLDSIKDVVDEIVIVHDGPCSDATMSIAESYNAKVFFHPFKGDSDPIFPFAYKKTSCEWILRIDADESLSFNLQQNIRKLISETMISAYTFLWPLYDGEKYRTKNWPHKLCLFRKSDAAFLGVPHFSTEIHGTIKQTDYLLEHKPAYNNYSWRMFRKKWIFSARIQSQSYLKDFTEIEKYNYRKNDWPFPVLFRRRFPLLSLILDPIIIIFKTLRDGAWREGLFGWNAALMYGCFRILVDWNILVIKYKKI